MPVCSTTMKGAVLRIGEVGQVREIRLIAPIGPRLGTVAVKVGKGSWLTVRLRSAAARRLQVFQLRSARARPLSGVLLVKAVKVPRGGAVAVDAIVAR